MIIINYKNYQMNYENLGFVDASEVAIKISKVSQQHPEQQQHFGSYRSTLGKLDISSALRLITLQNKSGSGKSR